jgi:hypothetical protein
VIGAGAGRLLHHRTASNLEKQAGATIPVGGAGLILAYPHSAAGTVQPAVTRAVQKVGGTLRTSTDRRDRRSTAEDGRERRLKPFVTSEG